MANLKRLYEMSTQEYIREFDKILDRDREQIIHSLEFDNYSYGVIGHTLEKHVGISDNDLLKRNIKEKRCTTSFMDDKTAKAAIYGALLSTKKSLARWFLKDEDSVSNFYVKFKKDIGYGIDLKFDKKTSDTIVLVVERARDANSELGFIIKTAYCDLSAASKFTGINYRELAEQIKGQKFSINEDLYRFIKNETDYSMKWISENKGFVVEIPGYESSLKVTINYPDMDFVLKSDGKLDYNFDYSDIFFSEFYDDVQDLNRIILDMEELHDIDYDNIIKDFCKNIDFEK